MTRLRLEPETKTVSEVSLTVREVSAYRYVYVSDMQALRLPIDITDKLAYHSLALTASRCWLPGVSLLC